MGAERYRLEEGDIEGVPANEDSLSRVDGEAVLKILRLAKEALGT